MYLECGRANKVVSVEEPATCRYAVIFETPLICYDGSMLVFPYLDISLQSKLNKLDIDVISGEVTEMVRHFSSLWSYSKLIKRMIPVLLCREEKSGETISSMKLDLF